MSRSSLNSINQTLDQLVNSLKIDHSLPSPSPDKKAPIDTHISDDEELRTLPQPQPDGVAAFEQLKATSVEQCNRANRELLNKLKQVAADNSRLQNRLNHMNASRGSEITTHQDTKVWSQSMANEMSGVSSACDEMQQVAQMLMKRVDTMRMPGLSFCPVASAPPAAANSRVAPAGTSTEGSTAS